MAYVSFYEFDVFISYASADNDASDDGRSGWVTTFVRSLEVALRQRLGGVDDLRVFFDKRNLSSNHELDALLAAARGSAVFLAVCATAIAGFPAEHSASDAARADHLRQCAIAGAG